jgi:hypothetical protein
MYGVKEIFSVSALLSTIAVESYPLKMLWLSLANIGLPGCHRQPGNGERQESSLNGDNHDVTVDAGSAQRER